MYATSCTPDVLTCVFNGVFDVFRGILALKRGAILVSLCWVAILVHIIDRKWWQAGMWAMISSLFAVVGIIHVPVSIHTSVLGFRGPQ